MFAQNQHIFYRKSRTNTPALCRRGISELCPQLCRLRSLPRCSATTRCWGTQVSESKVIISSGCKVATPYRLSISESDLLVIIHITQITCGVLQVSVQEELEPGILVGSLGKHFPPPYQLLTEDFLWMDTNTGNLFTAGLRMDREKLCPEVTTADGCIILQNAIVGPSGDLIQFPVIIEDINDNPPHFENSEIHLEVSEDIAVGAEFFLDDQAQDSDVGRNGQLRYHLRGSGGVFTLKFRDASVLLVVRAALDRETLDLYQMQLVAIDCGVNPLSASVALIVRVTDVNDNCPSFGPDSPHSATIPGDALKNTVVTKVVATDPDSGPNAVIVYSLSPKVSERARMLLNLNSHTGYVRLKEDLQNDISEELVLKVLASGPRCPPADTHVTISVLAKATQELTIKIGFIAEQLNQTMVLPENQPPTALAVLELEGDSSIKGSSLAIEGDVPFSLSLQSGKYLLSTSKPLDYEMKSEYCISVVVQGSSPERPVIPPSGREIRVMVEDVNDNAPYFLQTHYQQEVEENNQPGITLLQVSASDADSGHNGRVTYRLHRYASAIFSIDSVTGQLSALASLDREQQATYTLAVFAQDSGSPSLESQATVVIRVLDQNDNAPVFLSPHLIFFIPENVPPLTQVGRIEVRDPDEGENGNTELRVVNSSVPFVVDNSQRTLRTTADLDRETEDRYELYLLASDNGHAVALTTTARVTVFVEDVNDNQPKVILPSSNTSCLTLSPDTLAGTTVTKIYAVDEDSGLNSEITFSVAAPGPLQLNSIFQVDSRSGNITLSQQLLQEDVGMHHLFIVVRDNGKPAPLYTTVWVNLLVNESTEHCYLERAPTWAGTSELVQRPSESPICQVETTGSVQAFYIHVGIGLVVVSVVLLLITVGLFCRRSIRKHKKGCRKENEIPLSLKDKCYSGE
ncbi:protocadherin-20 [Nothobranchius furzeri]